MCSIFVSTMDNYQGDLTDILRASGTSSSSEPAAPQQQHQHQHHHDHHDDHWQHHHHNHHNFSSDPLSFSSVLEDHRGGNYFGDPFSTLRDPFLQELPAGSSSYFNINTSTTSGGLEQQAAATSLIDGGGGVNSNNNTNSTSASSSVFALEDPHPPHHDMRSSSSSSRPCKNIFSNMIQISPNAKLPYDSSTLAPSPRPIKPSAVVSPNISINATNTSKDSLVDNSGVQISSSRNTGLKRRKNQAKKVVCIPAPAAANSRQTGEVVPSDLWAWRKYGQKPIKGSPYPRGYYRCSSSKGCSARKQVERSRTDPNMLVITYTSEHNHPWPTQRNALAGSTRSQPSKTTNASLKNSETSQPQKGTTTKAKEEENNNSDGNINSPVAAAVKEEMEDIEKLQQLEMDEGEFSDGIGLPYKPSMMETNQLSHEDFFAELGEIEADPLNLLFTQGFGSAAADDHHQKESKALDPFHLFDWSENTNNTTNSFEEPNNKRRL